MICELPEGYAFLGGHEKTKSALYRDGKFVGYWWHNEPIEKALKRGYKPEKPWL